MKGKVFKKKGTLVTVSDLIYLEMGYEIILVDDVEKASRESFLYDFSDIDEDDEILI